MPVIRFLRVSDHIRIGKVGIILKFSPSLELVVISSFGNVGKHNGCVVCHRCYRIDVIGN